MKTLIYASSVFVLVAAATIALSRLEPLAPSVPRASVWVDRAQQGEMVIQVRGSGSLVPREIRWISAQTAGRLERVLVQPGAIVHTDSVLVEMSNADVRQQADEASFALEVAKAELIDIELRLKGQELDRRAAVGVARAEYEGARLRLAAEKTLFEEGIVSEIDYRVSELSVEQLGLRLEIEEERLGQLSATMDAQLTGARARVDQARNFYERRRNQIESLTVRAGVEGVLQELLVEEGQQIPQGSTIARIARPDDLQAQVMIPETQAGEVLIGQRVDIDTRNGVVDGVVARIDPAVQNGSVLVDVEIKGTLPRGARPDLSVDGTIEIERLDHVVYTGRPAYGQADSAISLFKLEPDGEHAVRVPVRLGRTSVGHVEIVQGLAPDDEVILSDMSNWDDYDRLRLD